MSAEPNFDRVAKVYRWAEYAALGTALESVRNFGLPALADAKHALVLGDGDGRFTAKLLETNAQVRVEAVDLSAQMLALLARRCAPHKERLTTVQANALRVELPPDVDAVVTHFFLDCFTQAEVDALAARIGACVSPGTLWLLSDFAIPPGPMALPAKLYVRSLYAAFGWLTGLRVRRLPDPGAALQRAGFIRIQRHRRLGGLLYTELWRHN